MAYLFGAAAAEQISAGTGVTHHGTAWSLAVRVKVTQVNPNLRRFVNFSQPSGGFQGNVGLVFKNGVDNQEELSHSFGGVFEQILWVSGFTAGSTHILVGTFGGTTFSLYADTDATAKATGTVSTPSDTDADQVFCIGNLAGLSHSADATLYEVGWWPGVTLTGAQAAILGGGGPATGVPLPTHYWPLISDAVALYGGVDGTVTGASVVAHAGTNWFPLAAARRRSLGLLGVGR